MSRRISRAIAAAVAALTCGGCPSSPSEPTRGGAALESTGGGEAREEPSPRGEPEAHDEAPARRAEHASPPGAAPATEPAAPTIPSGGVEVVEREGLRVLRLVLARNVEEREPVGASATFSAAAGGRVYAFIEVDNPARTEAELTISWVGSGSSEERGSTTVQVGAMPRWRTWAFTSVERHRGPMTAVVRDAEGNLLARAPFEVTE